MSYKTDFTKIDQDEYYYDERIADNVVKYIETHIRHAKGKWAGELVKLEEWQKEEIFKPAFGWRRKDNGHRKYSTLYIEIPKKSGKSFMAACFASLELDISKEGGSEIVGVAWGRKQAGLVFEATKDIIRKSPRLNKKCSIFRNSITAPDPYGGTKTYHILSKEAGSEDGINPQLAIIDELHVHKSAEVIEMVEKSMGAREQPLTVIITTAGSDLSGIGYKKSQYAKDVVQGRYKDEELLVCIYCAEPDQDIYSEETWKNANPNYNITVGKRAYEREARKARQGAVFENSFKRYYLNIWVNNAVSWISDTKWTRSSAMQLGEVDLTGLDCYAGLDLSSRKDITALSLIFEVEGRYHSLNWFWLPEGKGTGAVDGENTLSYQDWVRDGHIMECDGDTIDYDQVADKINELSEKYKIRVLAYDPWNSPHVIPKVEDAANEFIEFRQGFKSMNLPTKELEAAILASKFEHYNNPVLRWMIGNAKLRVDDADNIKVIKDKNFPHKKVDGVISNVMGFGALWNDKLSGQGSYLDDEDAGGLIFI